MHTALDLLRKDLQFGPHIIHLLHYKPYVILSCTLFITLVYSTQSVHCLSSAIHEWRSWPTYCCDLSSVVIRCWLSVSGGTIAAFLAPVAVLCLVSPGAAVWHLTSEALNVLTSVESLLQHLGPILLCVSLHVSLSVSLCVTVCVTACVSSWWQNSCWALLFVGWLGSRSLVVTNRTLCPPGHYSVFTDLVWLV